VSTESCDNTVTLRCHWNMQ